MYIAIVYGTSPVINCAIYKDLGSATALALQTPPQRQASAVNRIAMQAPFQGLARLACLDLRTQRWVELNPPDFTALHWPCPWPLRWSIPSPGVSGAVRT